MNKLKESYKNIFSTKEIESSKTLQWFSALSLLVFFSTFNRWLNDPSITIEAVKNNTYTCWPYFQNCGEYYFLQTLPYGYSQNFIYMCLFSIILAATYFIWKKNWTKVHLLISIIFIWKILVMFILSRSFIGNFDYYHILLTLAFLLLPHKIFFLRLSFVSLYFLASTVKFDEGWVIGSYFSSLYNGLPIFPDNILPILTNVVIFMQVIGAWFLFSKNNLLYKTTLYYLTFFHLYSGILVRYAFPTIALPSLLILFGPLKKTEEKAIPLDTKSIAGWLFMISLFLIQLFPVLFIKGDQKRTLEGYGFGISMIDANHQCISSATITKKNGTQENIRFESTLARYRCDPFIELFKLKNICKKNKMEVANIEWTLDHSINGGPFYRVVDEKNACNIEYKTLRHNEWIRTGAGDTPIIGYPVKNIYY